MFPSLVFCVGDGIWLSRTMARGGQSSVSKNRSSGSDIERSLLREWGWWGPAHLLYKWRRLFRPRRRDLDFGRTSNCNEEVACRHRNWYFQHFKQLLLWIKKYTLLCLYLGHLWSLEVMIPFKMKMSMKKNSTVNGLISILELAKRNFWTKYLWYGRRINLVVIGENWWGNRRDTAEKEKKLSRDSLRLCFRRMI